jgi:hypothetical protein
MHKQAIIKEYIEVVLAPKTGTKSRKKVDQGFGSAHVPAFSITIAGRSRWHSKAAVLQALASGKRAGSAHRKRTDLKF